MPTGRYTLIDAMEPNLVLGGVISEITQQAPEVAQFPIFRLDAGLTYRSNFLVELPSVGFRKLGDGVSASKGRWEEREFKCYLFAGRAEAEKAAGQADSGGMAAIEARAAKGTALAAILELGSQIFYGVANEADGFPGLKAFTPFGGAYTYNATGTTDGTASSVYGVKFGDEYARLVHGLTDPMTLGDFRDQDITGNNNKPVPGRVADLEGWIGLQIAHKASVLRICNLTAQSGKGLTDVVAGDALDLLPTGMKPDVWFMSKRSVTQLRKSRITPEVPYPPMPTDLEGIPIIVTDSILNTDSVES